MSRLFAGYLGTAGLLAVVALGGCGNEGSTGDPAGVKAGAGFGSEVPGLPGPARVSPPTEGRQGRTTICHATHSETNPYVTITVADAALRAHRDHQDREDIIPAPEGGCPGTMNDGGPPPDLAMDMAPPTDAGPDAPAADLIEIDEGTGPEGQPETACEPCRQGCTECEQKCDACTAGDAACLDKCRRCRLECDICACDCNGCEFRCDSCRATCYECATDDYACWSNCQSCRNECMACRYPSDDCQPLSCEDQGLDCGMTSDGCGRYQYCGDCGADEVCGTAARPNVCTSLCSGEVCG